MIYAVAKFRISSSRIWGNASDYKSLFHDFDINGTKKYYFNASLSQSTPPLLADCLVRETSVIRYGISKSARPLKRVSKATICSSRLLRKEGSLGFSEVGGKMAR